MANFKNLLEYLKSPQGANVPRDLQPLNVGPINQIGWPFHFSVNFDLGLVNNGGFWQYSLNRLLTQSGSFLVSSDSAFLLCYAYLAGGPLSANLRVEPILFDLTDAQSSRKLTIPAMPIASLGDKAHPFVFERPMYFDPNSRVDVTLSTFYTGAAVTRTVATAVTSPQKPTFSLVFYGYRTRVPGSQRMPGK